MPMMQTFNSRKLPKDGREILRHDFGGSRNQRAPQFKITSITK